MPLPRLPFTTTAFTLSSASDVENRGDVEMVTDGDSTPSGTTPNTPTARSASTSPCPEFGSDPQTSQSMSTVMTVHNSAMGLHSELGPRSSHTDLPHGNNATGRLNSTGMAITPSLIHPRTMMDSPNTAILANASSAIISPHPVTAALQRATASSSSRVETADATALLPRPGTPVRNSQGQYAFILPYNIHPIFINSETPGPQSYKKFCELCGVDHDGSYATGRFCSSRCARLVGGLAHRRRRLIDREMKQRNISKNDHQRCHIPTQERRKGLYASLLSDAVGGPSSSHSEITGPAAANMEALAQPTTLAPGSPLSKGPAPTPERMPDSEKELVSTPPQGQHYTPALTKAQAAVHLDGSSSASIPDIVPMPVASHSPVSEPTSDESPTAPAPALPPFLEPALTGRRARASVLASILPSTAGPSLSAAPIHERFQMAHENRHENGVRIVDAGDFGNSASTESAIVPGIVLTMEPAESHHESHRAVELKPGGIPISALLNPSNL